MSQAPIASPHTAGRIFDTDWSIANVARLLRSNAGRGVWRHAVTTSGSTGSVNRYYLRTVSARHLPSGVSLIFMRVEQENCWYLSLCFAGDVGALGAVWRGPAAGARNPGRRPECPAIHPGDGGMKKKIHRPRMNTDKTVLCFIGVPRCSSVAQCFWCWRSAGSKDTASPCQRKRAVQHAIVAQRRRQHIDPRRGPTGNLPPEFLPEGREQPVAGLRNTAADHDATRVEQHNGRLQSERQVHHVALHELRIPHQLSRTFSVIAFLPEAAAHPLQASAGAAKALGTIGADSEVPDLAAVGIGAAPDTAVLPDAAADSGGEGHVEERGAALSGAEFRLSDGAHRSEERR